MLLILRSVISMVPRLCVVLADLIVMMVTWRKTFHHVQEAAALNIPVSITMTLLRDGGLPRLDGYTVSRVLNIFLRQYLLLVSVFTIDVLIRC